MAGAFSGVPTAESGSPHESQWAILATLIRPHGRRGELLADILTDFPDRFHERTHLFLIPPPRIRTSTRQVDVENFWFFRHRLVVKLRGIDSINEAEALRGYDLAVPFAERAPVSDGSVYVSDLVGCRVVDLDRGGAQVGEIVDVDRESSNTELLVVQPPGERREQGDILIPFVRNYLARIDLAGRCVEMRLPPGLLEINAPMTEAEKREAGS